MRRTLGLVLGLTVLAVLLITSWAPAAPVLRSTRTVNPALSRVNVADLRLNMDKLLQTRGLAPENRNYLLKNLDPLPVEVQASALALLDPVSAERIGRPDLTLSPVRRELVIAKVNPAVIDALTRPWIDGASPEGGGSRDAICALTGGNYNNTCVVLLDGNPAPNTYHWSSNIILFRVPAAAPMGHVYQVSVRRGDNNKVSGNWPVKVVAPRGYRGTWGLQFPNFSATTIGWNVYCFVFGKSNVEFPDGTHRPTAQAWYDSTFKGAGNGGNCFGMSQLSLRLRKYILGDANALNRVMNSAWIKTHSTWGSWTLPWDNNSKEAVQGLQALQLVDPMASYIATQRATQDNKTAWTMADNIANTGGRPVQNTLYGHAVVTFDTETAGDSHRFCFYNNNLPYTETETGGPDLDHGTTTWSNGNFSYGSYTKTRVYDPNSLAGQPTLPAGVGGDNAADGAAGDGSVRFEVPRVAGLLINDEAGRGGADGVGIPGLTELTPDLGLSQVPASFPRIFLLANAAGHDISFNIPNQAGLVRQVACYSRGGVVLLNASGAQIRASFSQFQLPTPQLSVPDPQGTKPQQIRFLAPISQTEERVLSCDNFSGLSKAGLGAALGADRGTLEILIGLNAPPVQFRLQLQRFQPGGAQLLLPAVQRVNAGQLLRFSPSNWNALQGSQLRLENLQLPPGRLKLQ